MGARFIATGLATTLSLTPVCSAAALQPKSDPVARSSRVPVGKGSLYARDLGAGRPMIVLHGGPSLDQAYLLPDFDGLSDAFHIIYYDQRGRGERVSRLVLLNPAPASKTDYAALRKAYAQQLGADFDKPREIIAGDAYKAGIRKRLPRGIGSTSNTRLPNPMPTSD